MTVGHIQFVARELLSRADFLIPQWLPDGKRVGNEWVARNSTRQDAHLGSFKVNLRTGEWADFATEEKGTDLVSVFAHLNHLSQGEAAKRLVEAHGRHTPSMENQAASGPTATGKVQRSAMCCALTCPRASR